MKNVIGDVELGLGEVVLGEGRKGDAKRDQVELALKGKRNSIVEPAKRGARMAFTVPWMWWRGRTWRRWSLGV